MLFYFIDEMVKICFFFYRLKCIFRIKYIFNKVYLWVILVKDIEVSRFCFIYIYVVCCLCVCIG